MKSDKKDKINTEVNLLKALELKPVYSRIAKNMVSIIGQLKKLI